MDIVTSIIGLATANPVLSAALGTFLATHLNAKYQWIPKILWNISPDANPNAATVPVMTTSTAPTPTGQAPNDFILTRLSALEARITQIESKVLIVK